MFKITCSDGIKLRTHIVVPISFTASIAFGLHTVVAVGMWFTTLYALAYFLHDRAMQDLFYALTVEIAQHVGVTSTAGFDVTSGIDVQTPPGGCAVEIAHTVFTVRSLAPGRFGFAVVFSGIAIGDQHLS